MGTDQIQPPVTADDDGRRFLHPPFIGPYRTGPGTDIPEIVCVNLTTRPDRKRRMEALFAGYHFHIFEASPHPDPKKGNRESHLSVIERARDRGYPSVMIVEDDIRVIRDLATLPRCRTPSGSDGAWCGAGKPSSSGSSTWSGSRTSRDAARQRPRRDIENGEPPKRPADPD